MSLAVSAFQRQLVPQELCAYPQFVIWRLDHRGGKPAKVPHNPWTGFPASVTNRDHWAEWPVAQQAATENGFDGVGFVFTAGDPFAGVDLDRCRDTVTGVIEPWAQAVVEQLSSYTEISPSGTGVKIFVRGAVPGGGRRNGQVELYSERRFFTLTGQHLAGTPTTLNERQGAIHKLLTTFPTNNPTPTVHTTAARFSAVTTVVHTVVCGERQLQDVLNKALAARNGDKFERLRGGDTSEYGNDHSSADLALCRMLAYWCDHDPVLVDALFRCSGLMRDKWDENRGPLTYGQRTIQAAMGRTT